MAWSRPPDAPRPEWSLYARPGRRRRRWVAALAVAFLFVPVVIVGVLRLAGSGGPTPLPGATSYDALAAKTLRRCAPATTEDTRARDCLVIFRQGLDQLHLPSVADADLADLRASLQLEITCVAAPDEDDPNRRGWEVGCPQGGPTDPAAAQRLDARTAEDLYRRMLETDRAILVDLGLVPSPTP